MMPITICKPFSIVTIPFPFTDLVKKKKRPALVISSEEFQKENSHITLLMITTAKHSQWFGDYLITDLKTAQLPVTSYIRQKIFTIDSRLIEKKLGALSHKDAENVTKLLKESIAIEQALKTRAH